MLAETVYLLCALTSLGSALLLFRSCARSANRLVFWTAACFGFLFLNNLLLFLDLVVMTDRDLSLGRQLTMLAGVLPLVSALIWEVE